jgi:NADPH:quinone reductase-like Zn-dependent oxidoreductase
MKLYELRAFGLENLVAAERPEPKPQPHEVVVRIRAVSLNYRDLLIVRGHYNPKLKFPRVPLSDGAGEIVEVGSAVTAWKPGDRVVIPFMPDWLEGPVAPAKTATALGGDVDGLLREFAAIRADALLPIPAHLTFEEAAALPCAGVTAWNGLFVSGHLQPGQTLLLQGTGGVSLFGLQFGLMAGARVILTSSDDAKLERARSLGAQHTINYRQHPDWEKKVLEITGGCGVDLTLEVGGADTLAQTLRATRAGGEVSIIGVLSGIETKLNLGPVLHHALTLHGIYVGSREMFVQMNQGIERGLLHPVIDRVFSFADACNALKHMESGRHFGKIVIRID